MAMMKMRSVSVIDEWHKKRNHLNSKLLRMPAKSPSRTDSSASKKNWPKIANGVDAVNSKSDLPNKFYTVLNKIMETISLNTPSP